MLETIQDTAMVTIGNLTQAYERYLFE